MAAYTCSFIGTGSMGGALARAVCRTLPPAEVLLSNRTPAKAEALARELGCAAGTAEQAAREGAYIFLGVKPQMMGDLLEDVAPVLAARRRLEGGQLLLANRTEAKAAALAKELGASLSNNRTIAGSADYIFLGVKPQMMAGLLAAIAPVLARRGDRFVLVSMAAGLTMERIAAMAGGPAPVIRIMPNTPCAVGAGMVLYDANALVTEEELGRFTAFMAGAGALDRLEERLIDAGSAVSGCGPAFVCQFIEALADGGVACGLPRQKALLYAAQTLRGTARLMLDTGAHPGAMKDAVCSPAGSTIAGVQVLERRALRGAVMDAVAAAAQKNAALGQS